MDAAKFAWILESTMNGDNATREAAEKELGVAKRMPGYLTALMTVMSMSEMSSSVRLASALALKRACSDWSEDSPELQRQNMAALNRPDAFSEEDKAQVRASLVALAVAQSERPVTNALSDTLRLVAKSDFPHSWPDVASSILAATATGVPSTVFNSLSLAHAFLKCYEMESWDTAGATPGKTATSVLAPALLAVSQSILGGPVTEDSGRALSLCLKSLYRAVVHRFASRTALTAPPAVQALVEVCRATLAAVMPAGTRMATDEDSRWWHAKKWAVEIVYRLFEAYTDPGRIKSGRYNPLTKGEVAAGKAATVYLRDKAIPGSVVPVILTILKGYSDRTGWVSPRVLMRAFSILSEALCCKTTKAVVAPYLAWLSGEVVPQVLALTPDLMVAVEADPLSWINDDEDMMISWKDERSSADIFLNTAMKFKSTRAVVQPVLEAFLGRALGGMAAAGSDPAARAAALPAKEVALRILTLLSSEFRFSKGHRAQLQGLLDVHVTPELAPTNTPILRIRALRTWRAFMTSESISDTYKEGVVLSMLNALGDSNEAIRIVAADCINYSVQSSEAAATVIRPHLSQLMVGLFGMLDELGHTAVIELIAGLVQRFVGETPTMAGPMAQKLCQLLDITLAKAKAEAEDDDGSLEMSAGLVLETIQLLLQELTAPEEEEEDEAEEGGPPKRPAAEQEAKAKEKRMIAQRDVLPYVWRVLDALLPPHGDLAAALGRPEEDGDFWVELLDVACELYMDAIFTLKEGVLGCEEAWALLPRLRDAGSITAKEWIENLVGPLHSLADLGRARFAAAGAPPTAAHPALADAADPIMCYVRLLGAQAASTEATVEDRCLCSRLAITVQWYTWRSPGGQRLLHALVPIYVQGFSLLRMRREFCAYASVICMSMLISPSATVTCIQSLPGVDLLPFIQEWLKAVSDMKRLTEVKVAVLGLCELLKECVTRPGLGALLAPVLPGMVAVAVECAVVEDRLRMDAAALRASAKAAQGDEQSVNSAQGAEAGHENFAAEPEEEEEEEEDEDGEGEDDEEEEEDRAAIIENLAEEDDSFVTSTPMDHVDSKLALASTLQLLSSLPNAAALQSSLPPMTAPKLSALMAQVQALVAAGAVLAPLAPLPVEQD